MRAKEVDEETGGDSNRITRKRQVLAVLERIREKGKGGEKWRGRGQIGDPYSSEPWIISKTAELGR